MSPTSAYRYALALVFATALRDWAGATLYRLDASLTFALLRSIDAGYLLFHALALVQLVRSEAFTRRQRILGVLLQGLVALSVVFSEEPTLLFRSVREAILPMSFLVAGTVAGHGATAEDAAGRRWRHALVALLWLGSAVGVVQLLTVTSLEDYWFYRYASVTGEVFDEHNYIRFGQARGTGLGVSPFWLGYLGLGLAMFGHVRQRIDALERPDDPGRGTGAGPMLAGLVAGLASGSRLAAATVVVLFVATRWRVSPKLLLVGAVAAAAAYGPTAVGELEDTSVLGRADQLEKAVVDQLLTYPFGAPVPTGPTTIWFDSFVLNFIVSFGLPAFAVLVAFVATFAPRPLQRATTFALVAAVAAQALLQALEYTVFLPLAFLSLGLAHGYRLRGQGPAAAVATPPAESAGEPAAGTGGAR